MAKFDKPQHFLFTAFLYIKPLFTPMHHWEVLFPMLFHMLTIDFIPFSHLYLASLWGLNTSGIVIRMHLLKVNGGIHREAPYTLLSSSHISHIKHLHTGWEELYSTLAHILTTDYISFPFISGFFCISSEFMDSTIRMHLLKVNGGVHRKAPYTLRS